MISCSVQLVAADFATASPLTLFVNCDFSMLNCQFNNLNILSIRFLNVNGVIWFLFNTTAAINGVNMAIFSFNIGLFLVFFNVSLLI